MHKVVHAMSDDIKHTIERVYVFILQYIDQHGYAPNQREIANACYIGRSSVIRYLDRLEAQGRIKRDPGIARGLKIVDASSDN